MSYCFIDHQASTSSTTNQTEPTRYSCAYLLPQNPTYKLSAPPSRHLANLAPAGNSTLIPHTSTPYIPPITSHIQFVTMRFSFLLLPLTATLIASAAAVPISHALSLACTTPATQTTQTTQGELAKREVQEYIPGSRSDIVNVYTPSRNEKAAGGLVRVIRFLVPWIGGELYEENKKAIYCAEREKILEAQRSAVEAASRKSAAEAGGGGWTAQEKGAAGAERVAEPGWQGGEGCGVWSQGVEVAGWVGGEYVV